MIRLKRTHIDDQDFKDLVVSLNAELKTLDGEDHAFYQQFNGTKSLDHVLIAYVNDDPMACGALRSRNYKTMEIKRMFTASEARGQGLASIILHGLELWSKELGYLNCVLETGKRQKPAIELYKSQGYHQIPNYAPYIDVANSVCFGKEL
ncbi:GNAT family N-acetyltransferase [Flavimarina sp. Hel_I_48]|uniref:GNAT family N-acetyltransferase n=1 Tax=Flavimarina sp. Hel_I_48 TaxID=1392488 RepID=UPI0004DEE65B|nr:GNAT family N-acetyltransferase [Flavimarina sp. Hel_I_48]